MARHPNKEIEAALQYAEGLAWTVIESSRGHAWGTIRCPHGRGGCQKSIWSTPKDPYGHARSIRQYADRCPHGADEEEDQ